MQTLSLSEFSTEKIIEVATQVLSRGGLVIFPTETVYGAGVDATNQEAVNKLLQYKSRREGKPLSIAVNSIIMAEQYVEINSQATKLYERFLPGPVTVISKSKHQVASGVESEFGTLGVRIPDFPLITSLVTNLGKPITATSANASGKKSPYSVADIFTGLSESQKNLIDLVIDAGLLPTRPPSTVIDTTLSAPVTMRQGAAVLNTGSIRLISSSESDTYDIAGRLLLKNWNHLQEHGLVIGLDGSLGMGKTIFAKGCASFLKITDTITSPTYGYLEEYSYERHHVRGNFYHIDAWKVDSLEEWKKLEIEQLLTPGNLVVIEWWSQIKDFIKLPNHNLVAHIMIQDGAAKDSRTLLVTDGFI